MELSKQVVSRELAEKMKELGFVQESLFKYCGGHTDYHDSEEGVFEACDNTDVLDDDEYCHTAGLTCEFTIAAYTTSELGEMLPDFYTIKWQRGGGNFVSITNEKSGKTYFERNVKTEADARAKMLIYLAENNLINPKSINL